ncbi:DUF4268 domain-containing protein [Flavihumibacter stibioxidans]|uniref:DUF4268 domain-containing protein n=1 Tax=Flavihumibacter stibioxidans TaxID=1834163 RepID=A0ABR7MDL3_9BACT|nr:DUF4268 domain-containing protein [Flavihumibacter stibioxidans]MBC6493114.1 hypothetical protein [Flavihumibacter stibioxidans]
MYTKEQASLLRKQFFTAFGQYMLPVLSASGGKVNWLNYKTGLKHLYFRIEAPNRGCEVGIVMSHPDETDRRNCFGKLLELRTFFEAEAGDDWTWEPNATDEYGKKLSRIFVRLNQVSVLNQQDWPAIISFLKPRLVALDAFWSMARDQFEAV